MPLFGPPNIKKLKEKRNSKGLIKALDYEKDSSIRSGAAIALGQLQSVAAVEPLIAGLFAELKADKGFRTQRDKQPSQYAKNYVEALIAIGEPAVESLIALSKERTPAGGGWGSYGYNLNKLLIDTLSEIGTPAVPYLIASLNTAEEKEHRYVEMAVLGKIGDTRAIPSLIEVLKENHEYFHPGSASDALIGIGQSSIKSLVEVLRHPSSVARYHASRALKRLKWEPDQIEDEIFYQIAQNEWDKVFAYGNVALNPLSQIYESMTDKKNHNIATILGLLGDARGLQQIIEVLKTKVDYETRRKAARALVHLYQKGNLEEQDKESILKLRNTITQSHSDHDDRHLDFDGGCGHIDEAGPRSKHRDSGIGVPFPL